MSWKKFLVISWYKSNNETTDFWATGQPKQKILGVIKDVHDICQYCVIRKREHLLGRLSLKNVCLETGGNHTFLKFNFFILINFFYIFRSYF